MTGTAPALTWRSLPAPFRTVARWMTWVQVAGYSLSLLFVWHTTRMTPTGVALRYRGSDPDATEGAMLFAKSLTEMLTTTHTHVLAMAAIFTFSGVAVALCEVPAERWRRVLIAEPFAAILASFSAMWLMRYVHPGFAWLLLASSSSAAFVFYLQAFVVLRSLHRAERG